jgi:hypothetical protein
MESGSLKLLEPSGPHRACYGTPLTLSMNITKVVFDRQEVDGCNCKATVFPSYYKFLINVICSTHLILPKFNYSEEVWLRPLTLRSLITQLSKPS